ncbi:hypothetical protein NE237_017055 [Protea cynaroides]|uniref:Uncharacterized protein n=1 Tax=Protea cynaroides TaxID=273540 RepID=A0A9Q0K7C0_9MAGN|nr:hypothetical protein NE237_017055 [Protea cynaroides]
MLQSHHDWSSGLTGQLCLVEVGPECLVWAKLNNKTIKDTPALPISDLLANQVECHDDVTSVIHSLETPDSAREQSAGWLPQGHNQIQVNEEAKSHDELGAFAIVVWRHSVISEATALRKGIIPGQTYTLHHVIMEGVALTTILLPFASECVHDSLDPL